MLDEIYDYPLSPDSTVFDVGGYRGLWTDTLIERLGFSPNVYIFEPIFFSSILAGHKVQIFPFGLGAADDEKVFSVRGDGTGLWTKSSETNETKNGHIQDIAKVVSELGITNIDLISINCEGGEYDILERMIQTELVSKCKYIQIQYHDVLPNAAERRDRITENLCKTHEEKYNFPWRWEAWKRL